MSDSPEFLDGPSDGTEEALPKPVVAVVGRPNVGKSTLVNRILGRRAAVVQDVPGVTRDRVSYDAEWSGRQFVLVDTGGWASDASGMAAMIAEQAELAISTADAVLFVVDANVGTTDEDEAVVQVLRQSRKPIVVAANKVDDVRGEAEAATMWNLGMGEPHPVSAMHGRGSGDLLDALIEVLPESPASYETTGGPRRVAIVGRPNVGKSSLLNRLARQNRAVVSDVSGTTVDPVDELVTVGSTLYQFIDTAGLRKRVKEASGHEYYASLRTQAAIERAEVCVVQAYSWAPRVNISALKGRNVDKLEKAIETAAAGWETRISTGKLNAFLGRLAAAHPHPVRGGKQPRILFGTQAHTCPPTFALFTSGMFDQGYVRFIIRRLREDFGFAGSPVHVEIRPRERRGKK